MPNVSASLREKPWVNRPPAMSWLSMAWPPTSVTVSGRPSTGGPPSRLAVTSGGSGWAFGHHRSSSSPPHDPPSGPRGGSHFGGADSAAGGGFVSATGG